MKSLKLFVSVAVSCLLLGVSGGAAMAEGCGDGVLYNEPFNGNLVITDEESCAIIGNDIPGNLRASNVSNLLLLNNKVGGTIRVEGIKSQDTANVVANTVFQGRIIVKDYEQANVIENETLNPDEGNIRVSDNISALVQKNIAARNLRCPGNTTVDSFLNAAGMNVNCE